MIKKLRIIFFASASIIALFCVWYPVCYLVMIMQINAKSPVKLFKKNVI